MTLLKNKRILIVAIFNVVQFLIAIWGFSLINIIFSLVLGVPVLFLTYFLLKGSKISFYILLVWFALQTFTFNFPNFSFELEFGLVLDLHIMDSPIGFNPFTAIMFIILLSTKKVFTLKEDTEKLEPLEV